MQHRVIFKGYLLLYAVLGEALTPGEVDWVSD